MEETKQRIPWDSRLVFDMLYHVNTRGAETLSFYGLLKTDTPVGVLSAKIALADSFVPACCDIDGVKVMNKVWPKNWDKLFMRFHQDLDDDNLLTCELTDKDVDWLEETHNIQLPGLHVHVADVARDKKNKNKNKNKKKKKEKTALDITTPKRIGKQLKAKKDAKKSKASKVLKKSKKGK